MEDGTILKGRVIFHHADRIQFREMNLGLLNLETKKISYIEAAGNGMYFLFYMKDGSFLHGKIVSQNETDLEVETKSIGKQKIPLERIKEMRRINEKDIRRKGKYWYPNMNAARYFFSPSAIPQNENEGNYQVADVLVNSMNYGVTKNFSLGGGAILPFGVFIMPKYAHELTDILHVGGCGFYAQTLLKYKKRNYKGGGLLGLLTVGNGNNNLTFGLGTGFEGTNEDMYFLPKPAIQVSATLRISRRIAFVGENFFLPARKKYYTAEGKVYEFGYDKYFMYGFRLLKERASLDAGFLFATQDTFLAFPYIGLAIKF